METIKSYFMFTYCCPPEPGAAWPDAPATDGDDPDSPTPSVVGTVPEDKEGFFRMPFGRGLDAEGGKGVISCLSGIISTLISYDLMYYRFMNIAQSERCSKMCVRGGSRGQG
jgi:hypothetical protein